MDIQTNKDKKNMQNSCQIRAVPTANKHVYLVWDFDSADLYCIKCTAFSNLRFFTCIHLADALIESNKLEKTQAITL